MAFLMFIALVTLTLIAYYLGNKDLLSPWFLLCLIFLGSYSLVLLNYNNWEVKINATFVVYIITAILAFGLGVLFVKSLQNKSASKTTQYCTVSSGEGNFSSCYPVNLFIFLSVIFTVVYIAKLISDIGLGSSFSDTLRRIYNNNSSTYSPGTFFTQLREVVMAIAYLNVYRLLYRLYSRKDKVSVLKLIIPIVIFLIMALITTERNLFLRFAIYCICVWVLIYRQKFGGKNVNGKIIIRGVAILAVVILLFFLFGKAKQYTSDFFKSISIYAGSGLYDFNLWIQDFNEPLLYGQSTFTTFLGSLGVLFKPFGITLQGTVNLFDPFIEYSSANGYFYSSNIYTALRPYVEDFGYFGVLLIPFFIGVFYQWIFTKVKRSKFGFSWILYSMLIYPVIYFPISEQLFRRFHFGLVYEIVWICLLYYFVFGRKRNRLAVSRNQVV